MRKKIIGNVVKGSKLWKMSGFLDISGSSNLDTPIILGANKEKSEGDAQPEINNLQLQRYSTWQLGLVGVELDEARLYFNVDSKAEGHSFVMKREYQEARKIPFVIGEIEKKLNRLDKYAQK